MGKTAGLRYIKFLSVFCLLGLIASAGFGAASAGAGQPPAYVPGQSLKFKQLSVEAGLSQSSVYAILQDSQGFVWLGTQDGLNRYDGYAFKVWKPDPDDPNSLSDRWIFSLTEDQKGNLWIGTRQGGLNHYDRQTGRFTRYLNDPTNPNSLSDNLVRSLYVDRTGNLWIGTNNGLDRFDPDRKTFSHYRHDSANPNSLVANNVRVIHPDQSGALWIGTYGGMSRFNPQTGQFTNWRHDEANPNSLLDNSVCAIYQDRQGNLWIGTSGGLDRLDPATQTLQHLPSRPNNPGSLSHPTIEAIIEDETGALWVGTLDGLNRFDQSAQQFTVYRPEPGNPNSLGAATILSIYQDREGSLWVGTFGGGVNMLDRGRMKFAHWQNNPNDPRSLGNNFVFQLAEDRQGYIWIATYGGGLDRLDRATGLFTHYRHDPADPISLTDDRVNAVYEDKEGVLWVGTDAGLDALDRSTGHFAHYPPETGRSKGWSSGPVYNILQDQYGTLWFGARGGLVRLDRATDQLTHFRHDEQNPSSLSGSLVIALYETREGELWIGTSEGGLNLFDRGSGQFRHFRHDRANPQSLTSDSILAIYQDRAGGLWVATTDGLNRFDRQAETFTRYTEKNGLPNNVVYGIVEDDQGYLWLSTNNGVARFDPRTETCTNFDEGDGLQSREFNMNAYLKSRTGDIFFGGIKGLNAFHPDRIGGSDYVPELVLTNLTQEGRPVQSDRTMESLQAITLRWPQNYFEFEFAALSYAEPDKNQYTYRLEGFEQDWSPKTTRHFGRYTNLPGGNYTLRVKGSNNDSVWNDTGISLRVVVVPPVWETWWFRGAAIALAGLTVLGGYRLRVRSIKQHSLELERQVRERTQEIEQLFEQTKELAIIEERNRLARDLHDSAKQKAFAALAQLGTARSTARRNSAAAQDHLDEAENLVYEVIQELTFLIQEMYPMALKEKGLAAVLREYIYEWEGRTDIHVNQHVSDERRLPLQIEQALYRVTQESLANVARHSRASQVEIGLSYNDSHVDLTITDNGCGFDLQQKPTGVGLRSIRERAGMIDGQIEIESRPGQGTRIHICAPVHLSSTPNGNKRGQNGSSNHHPDRG